jgi:hypothetical protein
MLPKIKNKKVISRRRSGSSRSNGTRAEGERTKGYSAQGSKPGIDAWMPGFGLDFRPLLGIHLQCIVTLTSLKMKPFSPI